MLINNFLCCASHNRKMIYASQTATYKKLKMKTLNYIIKYKDSQIQRRISQYNSNEYHHTIKSIKLLSKSIFCTNTIYNQQNLLFYSISFSGFEAQTDKLQIALAFIDSKPGELRRYECHKDNHCSKIPN